MKRISRVSVTSRPALLGAAVLLTLTSASVAAADDGRGPLGVTVDAVASRPSARVGALFDADRAGRPDGGHFCTASVVHSPRGDLIVTAAHCVAGARGDLVFVPGYREGRAPYGVWKVTRRFLPGGWVEGEDEDSDLAFAAVADRGGDRLEDAVGANRFTPGVATGATAVTVTGYPDAREKAITCTNRPAPQSSTQQRIDCPGFTGGTSGSPWVNGDHQVVGVLGGHEHGGTTADTSYSVVLGAEAAAVYERAVGAPRSA
ncbi:trypsin-like peptidase domain-containing protein [Streptomyces sp. NPDC015171]|uniref:trypsin-like peptidase domain-containing protein n=1 Tax=Streptomyces sp. NPDC015171 TaxID=3364945 RepID=UPI0036FC6099